MQPVTLGVFFNDLVATAGIHVGVSTYAVGALLCCIWPAWIAYRGISLSTKGALAFLLFETSVVTALCLSVVFIGAKQGVHFSTEGFHLSSSPGSTTGI